MAKNTDLPGVWGALERQWTLPMLARMVEVPESQIIQWANNLSVPESYQSMLLADIMTLHGTRPSLYQQWDDNRGVMISSTPWAWLAWSLESGWQTSKSRWFGKPTDLKPVTPETYAAAQAAGWPF